VVEQLGVEPGDPGASCERGLSLSLLVILHTRKCEPSYHSSLISLTHFHDATDIRVDFVIPTGAMGNIVGGYMAKKMDIPIGKLCAGTNINDITFRVMETGKFYKSDRMEKTLSDAIKIQLVRSVECCCLCLLCIIHTHQHEIISHFIDSRTTLRDYCTI